MADNIPVVFRRSGDPTIASYSYTDLAEGTGVVKYYAFTTRTSSGIDYNLGTSQVYSSDIDTRGSTITGTTYTASVDLDFDLTSFNTPRTIRGTAILNCCWRPNKIAGASYPTGYLVVYVRKWDGASETDIATITSDVKTDTIDDPKFISCLPITIPKTHFKVGETLRLTIQGWCKSTNPADEASVDIGHDPRNRDGSYIIPSTDDPESTTVIEFYCPFALNL